MNVNQRVSELTGWSRERLLGKKVFGDLLVANRQTRQTVGNHPIETLMVTASGDAIPVEVIWKPYRSGLRANEVYAVRDLQERRLAEETIRRLATTTLSPGFPIERALRSGSTDLLADGQASGWTFAVLCLDLDRFKEVNDLYGHGAGDQVLRLAADRMSAALGRSEILGRVGGDEFAVLQSEGLQPNASAELAARLIDAFSARSKSTAAPPMWE